LIVMFGESSPWGRRCGLMTSGVSLKEDPRSKRAGSIGTGASLSD
jgi:hypothetical protein